MRQSYFLLAVSNRQNLDLCIRHALAGFSNSGTGVWAYVDIREGDYISFLYAARAFNLYKVIRKEAIIEFQKAAPWPPVTFRESNKTYYYPFRLYLQCERHFTEPLVRAEFAYVAENLLLRAGYRKTHFQADQTTLQVVSQMGSVATEAAQSFEIPAYSAFVPRFTRRKSDVNVPLVCPFNELILQAAIRRQIAEKSYLERMLGMLGVDTLEADVLEVLSEKAVSEGHVDILIKDLIPIGVAHKLILEAKLAKAELEDLSQLQGYTSEFGVECVGQAVIAEAFPKTVLSRAAELGIRLIRYELICNWDQPRTFAEILENLRLILVL